MSTRTAAILLIGNELLSGRTQDTNLRVLATMLSEKGVSLEEARVVKDRRDSIVKTVRELSSIYTYLFTTGGIGATHDDITASCVAEAFEVELVENPDALGILKSHYQDQLNAARRRMALMPTGAQLIENPVSAAPGFRIGNTFVLAGLPVVMTAMIDFVRPLISQGPAAFVRSLTCNLREGTIADDLAHIQRGHSQVEIGSYPFFRGGDIGVNLVVRGIEGSVVDAAAHEIEGMIHKLGGRCL